MNLPENGAADNAILRRPGHGACNQIAATAAEQLARAQLGRPSRAERRARRLAELLTTHPEIVAPALAAVLAEWLAAALRAEWRAA